MAFDMPPDIPADKQEYENWEFDNALEEVRMIGDEASEQEAQAIAVVLAAAKALGYSHKLLRHYAELLNMHDGGARVIPESVEDWIKRCQEVAEKEKQ